MACGIFNISQAAVIAIHAARFIALSEEPIGAKEIAKKLGVSQCHLSKVLRKLVVAGIISVGKGPRGGFFTTKLQRKKTFMDIYKAVDVALPACDCLLEHPNCDKQNCIFGSLIKKTYAEFEKFFSRTKISL